MNRFLLFLAALAATPLAHAKDTLEAYPSCQAWNEAVSGQVVEQLMAWYGYDYSRYYGYYGALGYVGDAVRSSAAEDSAAPASAATSAGSSGGPSSYTGTNVQEQGVDELDFVKTDGKFIYMLNGTELAIVRSWPAATAAKVSSIAIEGTPTSLFLRGDRVVVASVVQPVWDENASWYYAYGYGYYGYGSTRLTVIDVSDRTEPTVVRTVDVQGSLVSGRMVDGDVYMVLNAPTSLPGEVWNVATDGKVVLPLVDPYAPVEAQEKVREAQRAILGARVKAILAANQDAAVLPYKDSRPGQEPISGRMLGCDQVFHAGHETAPGTGMLALVHLDLDVDDSKPDASGIQGQGWTVYASEDNLYASLTTGSWWWGWNSGQEIEPGTEIHKFKLRGKNGGPEYVASGHIDGWLWSQFAMSEHEGNLRVASTDQDWWWGTGRQGNGSQVTVLADDNEGHLTPIGKVDDIAPGEQIYGVRFVGDKGYLVTFRQVDPLHVLDLSNPRNPRVTGELHIPGYSSYLHPMDEDHLLAVGMDGDMDGRIKGMKVSIFDVSDPANPKESHKYTIAGEGWGWSEALSNHHAFTWANGVLTIPAYEYTYEQDRQGNYTYKYWSGALVLRADPFMGLWEMGRIDHGDLARKACVQASSEVVCDQTYASYGYYYGYSYGYYAQMRRSIYIDDTLVTISNLGVKFNSLRRPENELATVMLPEGANGWYAYY